ncbi:MAG: TRAP transporter large permease subunit [Burkholderiales bacterium]
MPLAGASMLVVLAVTLLATGLPSWVALIGVAMLYAAGGLIAGAFPASLLAAMPGRVLGLMESDILQALPLYVLMGALLVRMPLAATVYRALASLLARTGAGPPLAGLTLAALLSPMNGSVAATALMLGRTVAPRLAASGALPERATALTCAASTLGVVIPPSLVLILLGDAMMRAHTEALNATRAAVRIVNTQDVFTGALLPAAILFALMAGVAWLRSRETQWRVEHASFRDLTVAAGTIAFIVALLAGVTAGILFAVEAAAAGAVALLALGAMSGGLTRASMAEVLRDALAISGALFSLLVAATIFTLVLRAFGTDRWLADLLSSLPGGAPVVLVTVLAVVGACALVLDAFEMIFVVIPIAMPPLLAVIPDAAWVSVVVLLVLAATFATPPMGYAVLLARQAQAERVTLARLLRELAPFLAVQWVVLALVLAVPQLVWHRVPMELPAAAGEDAGRDALIEQLQREEEAQEPATQAPVPPARP